MKSSELHRQIKKKGWIHVRTKGSHYIYEKDGKSVSVPYHGSAEVAKGIQRKFEEEMGL